jgi:DNA-binding response OmpR family regulator
MVSSAHAPRPVTVLVVDNDPDLADSTAEFLALHGFAARTAETGEAALSAAAIDPPDAVLLDLVLPGMDGYEVARRLAGAGGDHRPLFIAVTGLDGGDTRRRSAAAGIDLHLVKPVDPGLLVGVLARYRDFLTPPEPAAR